MESHNRCDVGNSYKCVCQPFYRHDGIRCRRMYVKLSCNAVDHLIHLPSLRECLLSKSDDEFYKLLHEFSIRIVMMMFEALIKKFEV